MTYRQQPSFGSCIAPPQCLEDASKTYSSNRLSPYTQTPVCTELLARMLLAQMAASSGDTEQEVIDGTCTEVCKLEVVQATHFTWRKATSRRHGLTIHFKSIHAVRCAMYEGGPTPHIRRHGGLDDIRPLASELGDLAWSQVSAGDTSYKQRRRRA